MRKAVRTTLAFLVMAPALAVATGIPVAAATVNNPVQCLASNLQCAREAASGDNPCDPLPC